jgi:hypothetical protein
MWRFTAFGSTNAQNLLGIMGDLPALLGVIGKYVKMEPNGPRRKSKIVRFSCKNMSSIFFLAWMSASSGRSPGKKHSLCLERDEYSVALDLISLGRRPLDQ